MSYLISDQKWHTALRRAWLFGYVPFVDFVLVGGSLALGTARRDSDIDVIVGTCPGRLYTARFFCLLFFTIAGWRRTVERPRDGFCFNYFVSSAGALGDLPAGGKNPRDEYNRRLRAALAPLCGAPETIQKFLERSGNHNQKWNYDLRYRRTPKRGKSHFPRLWLPLELLLRQWQVAVMKRFMRRRGNPEGARFAYTEDRVELCLSPHQKTTGVSQWMNGVVTRRVRKNTMGVSPWWGDLSPHYFEYPAIPLDNILRQDILISAMNIKPLSDHVFLEAIEEDRVTKSGIILPDTAEKERPIKGRVIAVGPGKRNDRGEVSPMSVKVGDTVLFKKYGPDEIELDGKKYLVAEENEILGVLESGGAGVSKIGTSDINIRTSDVHILETSDDAQNINSTNPKNPLNI